MGGGVPERGGVANKVGRVTTSLRGVDEGTGGLGRVGVGVEVEVGGGTSDG